ncbi:helix-turn-helix domain-containing protein [Metabacillus niabensis]|uniref:helix-turn-helix domain-containing protein n=1 Tax=Metabacillus niabensis TaxID=324854 RepID=UPI0039A0D240
MKTLGERLRELRKNRKLTQTELANLLHLTRNQISTYEKDQVVPSLEVIVDYCLFFNTSADYLLNIGTNCDDAELEQQLFNQILNSSKRLTPDQRKKYLNQLKLYAIFLERYKESL